MSESAALQKHVFDLLKTSTAVMALIDDVYDRVPSAPFSGANKAYISFGPQDYVNADAECIAGGEYTLQLDIWSRNVGAVHCKRVCDAVRKVLHQDTTELTGPALAMIEVNSVRVLRDPDGLTEHGIVTVTAHIEDA